MGRDRDVPLDEKSDRVRHFSDDDICKFHLAGLCPYQLFKNTKSDLGPYDKILDDVMKAAYEECDQLEKDKYGYERNLLDFLENLVADLDRRVQRGKARIKQEQMAEQRLQSKLLEALSAEERTKLQQILAEIDNLNLKSQQLEAEDKVDETMEVMERIETLKQQRTQIESKLGKPLMSGGDQKKLVLCEVSGNFLSSTDSAERLRAHFEGKQYKGWKSIRDKYNELKAKRPPRGIKGYCPEMEEEEKKRAAKDKDSDRDKDKSRRGEAKSGDRDRKSSRPGDDRRVRREYDHSRDDQHRSSASASDGRRDYDRRDRRYDDRSRDRGRRERSRSRERGRRVRDRDRDRGDRYYRDRR